MSLTKIISITDVAEINVLSTRSLADRFIDLAESKNENEIVLDFSNIISATRSFFDQLLARINSSNKKITLQNMSPTLTSMVDIVKA